nr:MAG TPA: hypothetical protein [Caudoviricetes sp.]
MVERIKKLDFLDFLVNTECEIVIYSDEISEDGGFNEVLSINKQCIYQEKTEKRLEANGKEIILNGIILVKGDLNPNIKTLSIGKVKIESKEYTIHKGYRIFNPDGTVNHTKLEII